MKKNIKNNGFTLAEVLITLVIIGVIAAITVPTLINKTNNQETVSRLKKAYSTLAQATNKIIAEEGKPKNNWVDNVDNVYNLYKKHLLTVKECGGGVGCSDQGNYKTLKGRNSGAWNSNGNYRRFILADGVQVNVVGTSGDCTYNWTSSGSNLYCAELYIDINGQSKPNSMGKDVFLFIVKENGLYPAGCDFDTCADEYWGVGCTCKVLREGAINY